MRTCRRCQRTQPITEFYTGRHICKACYREGQRRNPERTARAARLRRQRQKIEREIADLRQQLVLRATRLLLSEYAELDDFAQRFREVARAEGYTPDHPVMREVLLSIGDGSAE